MSGIEGVLFTPLCFVHKPLGKRTSLVHQQFFEKNYV